MGTAKKTTPSGSLPERTRALIAEVEGLARRLRADLKRRIEGSSVARQLERAAAQLRTRAAAAAGQVEGYAHRLRVELERTSRPGRGPTAPVKRKRAAPRRGARPGDSVPTR